MTTYVGGLRVRLIQDNVFDMLEDALDALGWFDVGRDHETVELVDEEPDWDTPITPNKVSVIIESINDFEAELGSNLMEERHNVFIDIYAEDDATGIHLSNDIRDILRGKFPSISRTQPRIDIYDKTMATPAVIFTVEVEDARWDRGRSFSESWLKHWFVVSCTLVDTYGDEDDA